MVHSPSVEGSNSLTNVGGAPTTWDSVALRWRSNRGTIGGRDERKMKRCASGGAAIRGSGR